MPKISVIVPIYIKFEWIYAAAFPLRSLFLSYLKKYLTELSHNAKYKHNHANI